MVPCYSTVPFIPNSDLLHQECHYLCVCVCVVREREVDMEGQCEVPSSSWQVFDTVKAGESMQD